MVEDVVVKKFTFATSSPEDLLVCQRSLNADIVGWNLPELMENSQNREIP